MAKGPLPKINISDGLTDLLIALLMIIIIQVMAFGGENFSAELLISLLLLIIVQERVGRFSFPKTKRKKKK